MTRLVLLDMSRQELFTEDPHDHREITAAVWYPGDPVEKAAAVPYYARAGEIVRRFPYPDSLADIGTSSWLDIPVAPGKDWLPVIVFSHGWGEHVGQNTVLMEELASHGYVVFSIAHHHEAKFWVYPDERIEYLNPQRPRFQKIMAEQNNPGMMDLYNAMFTARGSDEQLAVFRRTIEAMPTMLRETPRIWAQDISFVIDMLDSLNTADGRFRGRLDTNRVGVMGMSMGGIAAGQACISDTRIKACINCDGGLFGDLIDTTLTLPVMFMGSKRFIGYEETFLGSVTGDAYTVIVADADHYDFTDFTLLHREHILIGTVDGHRMLRILNDYALGFFDSYLKEQIPDLIMGTPSPYSEVEFRIEKPE
jgi:predicted dienelactone hydrolase